MILMNLHRGHGVRVALCQVLQGAVVPVRATRIIKVSLTIVHDHNDHDDYVHVDIAVSQNELARFFVRKAEQKLGFTRAALS